MHNKELLQRQRRFNQQVKREPVTYPSRRLLVMALMWSAFTVLYSAETTSPIHIPVRIHLVSCEQETALTTTLTAGDIQRIIAKVNTIWAPANIQFTIESIGKTTAQTQDNETDKTTFSWVTSAMPQDRLLENGLNLFYIKEMGPNGFYSKGLIYVKDTARLNPVPGGLDEPIPRVSAHEIGHALSLQHRQEVTNLMASGKNGYLLNEAEIEAARRTALTKFGSLEKKAP
jgi:hypothetical protein